jgi:hypothetical protein
MEPFSPEMIRAALDFEPEPDDEGPDDFKIMMMGEPAFDWLAGQVRGRRLSKHQMSRALYLAARTTNQAPLRTGDLFDIARGLAVDANVGEVARNWAMKYCILTPQLRKYYRDGDVYYRRSVEEMYEQVTEVVHEAMRSGVSPSHWGMAKRYLVKHDPKSK